MGVNKESYRQIVKNTSLFGGVQVVQILSALIRGKIVALLLGTVGMGINTLLNSVVTMIVQLSSLGINFSAVRDISQANENEDHDAQVRIITIFKRWILCCAILGALIISLGAKWLSNFTFGNGNFTLAFVCLSAAVVLTILNSGNITVLQGTRRLEEMAKVSVYGAILGLILCVPIYFLFREKGIVPGLIISVFAAYLFSWFQLRNSRTKQNQAISFKETFNEGSEMAKLGLAMMVATLIGSAVNYMINAYISKTGSLSDVGLFGAGMSITNQYVGVVFTAMAVDYFPRLSAICTDKKKVNEMVNQQAEVVLLIVTPLIIGMMLMSPVLIRLLLSSEFLAIADFVCLAAFAMFFKAASFSMGYISFAKGDKKIFFLFEGVMNSFITLIGGIVGYNLGGINGIAIATILSNALYLSNVSILTYRRYDYRLTRSLIMIFVFSLGLLSITLSLMLVYQNVYTYVVAGIIFLLSVFNSFKGLDDRVHLKSFLLSKLKR